MLHVACMSSTKILRLNLELLSYTNLGQILNFSEQFSILHTSSDHDIIPMAYHPCIFGIFIFLNKYVMLGYYFVVS